MIVARLFGIVLDFLLMPLRLLARMQAKRAELLRVTIDGPVVDILPPPRPWQLRARKASSVHTFAQVVDAAIAAPNVRGILLVVKHFGAGMATATSLRAEMMRARTAGKDVIVHLPLGGDSKETFIAMAATRVVLGPAAQLAPVGFLSESRYLRQALGRAGVSVEVFACGEYKSAGETFVRDSMSDPQREQLTAILTTFHRALVTAISEKTGLASDRAEAIVDGAPYDATTAIAAGLADSAAYEDEIPALVGLVGKGAAAKVVEGTDFLRIHQTPLVRSLLPPPIVAVIPIHGMIAHTPGMFDDLATDERVERLVRLARVSRRVKAVIVHVDSPGGSAIASDRIHHELSQLAREKPVVACMANVAASGGYYVSVPAHRIVCEPNAVTGSIGVVGARFSPEPLLSRLGVTTESIQKGSRAGLLSTTSPLDDDERAAMNAMLLSTYRTFVRVVANGRKIREVEVEALARGRVYTGEDAYAQRLVDHLGGFEVAMREVRKLLPFAIRDEVKPAVLRATRRTIPLLDPPPEGTGLKTLTLLAALLPPEERGLLELAASGERTFLLWG